MRWARGSGKVSASTETTPLSEETEGLSYRNHAPGAVGRLCHQRSTRRARRVFQRLGAPRCSSSKYVFPL